MSEMNELIERVREALAALDVTFEKYQIARNGGTPTVWRVVLPETVVDDSFFYSCWFVQKPTRKFAMACYVEWLEGAITKEYIDQYINWGLQSDWLDAMRSLSAEESQAQP